MSRPGKTSSRCLKKAVSIAVTSSKCPWMGQSLTMTILPSYSRMVALISPTVSLRRIDTSLLPSRISWRASRTQVGQSESVSRGQPSGGLVFWCDFRSGLSDQRGVNEGFCLIVLAVENTCQRPLAATAIPFSTYFIGACMRRSPDESGSAEAETRCECIQPYADRTFRSQRSDELDGESRDGIGAWRKNRPDFSRLAISTPQLAYQCPGGLSDVGYRDREARRRAWWQG